MLALRPPAVAAGIATGGRIVRWLRDAASPLLRAYYALLGLERPAFVSPKPLVEKLDGPTAVAVVAGAAIAAVSLILSWAGYGFPLLMPAASIVLGAVLGSLWARRSRKQRYSVAESAFGYPFLAYALTYAAMVVLIAFGGRQYTSLTYFPVIFVFSVIFTVLGGTVAARLMPVA